MSDLAQFFDYVQRFELAHASDDWSIIEPCFAPGAVHRVAADVPFAANDCGRDAVVAGLAAIVRALDRRFDARIPEIIEGPSVRDGGVWMRFRLTLSRTGLPDLVVEGTHLAIYENGTIIRLDESVSPEACAATRAYLAEHDAALRPVASAPSFPTDARDLARIDAATKAAIVRCYGHAKSRQDIIAALAICSDRFSIETVCFGVASRDKQDTASQLEIFFRAFPDYGFKVEELICNEAGAACSGTVRMTFAGDFLGLAPTNRTAELPGFCLFTFDGAQLASERFFFDLASLCEQTGLPLEAVRNTLRQLREAA
jgi:predicted ester cyclase